MKQNSNLKREGIILILLVVFIIILANFGVNAGKTKEFQFQEIEKMANEALNDCIDKPIPDRRICYTKKFENLSYQYGQENAFAVLFALQKKDNAARSCHFIAHGIGWGAFRRNPSLSEVQRSRTECAYGAQMGIMELWAGENEKITNNSISTICGPLKGRCNHGVGHILLLDNKGKIDDALEVCNGLREETQRLYCYRGVFMENITVLNLADHGIVSPSLESSVSAGARLGEFNSTCRRYEGERALACWHEISHSALWHFNNNLSKVISFCNASENFEEAKACKLHAISLIFRGNGLNLSNVSKHCQIAGEDSEFQKDCYLTLLDDLIVTLPKDRWNRITQFCESLPEFNDDCFAAINSSDSGTE